MSEPIRRCTRDGCKAYPVKGATVCRMHGGTAPQTRRKAIVRAELEAWDLPDTALVDPLTTMLRMITQAVARAELYASWIRQLLEELPLDAGVQTKINVLIGTKKRAAGSDGIIFDAEEALRGLTELEGMERDRVVNWSAKAVAAGAATKQVEIAQAQAAVMYRLIVAAVDQAGVGQQVADQIIGAMSGVIREQRVAIEQ